jgi:hypothetical protein
MPKLISCKKIWDKANHNAFTDLLHHEGNFYCCFREGEHHAGGSNGKIRILKSSDAVEWSSVALISKRGIDLRDPMLSITPNGQWLLNMGGTKWKDETQLERNSYVVLSADGIEWKTPEILPYPGEWIWRLAWHQETGYAFSYAIEKDSTKWSVSLVSTSDGKNYEFLKKFDLPHSPNETTLRFMEDGTMVALVRCRGPYGLIGHSSAPYEDWKWVDIGHRLGGPNFLIENDSTMWASSRRLIPKFKKEFDETVVFGRMGLNCYEPLLLLPSGGDCGYPGMVHVEDRIYISYYSSHEGKSQIYLAIIELS